MKEKFALWQLLFLKYVQRDWKKILLWVVLLGGFSGGFVPFFEEIAKGTGLQGMFETMQNPAMVSMVGPTPVTEASQYTIGAMYAHEMLLFCGLFAMIMTALHVIGHTRKEEDLGLQELIRSFRVGRQANSLAVMVEMVLINLLVGIFTAGLMISFQVDSIDATGSVLFGASVSLAGILGGVIALFFAQIMATSAGATGASLGFIGLLYLLRGASDVTAVKWSMANPMGWTYLTHPFTENRWYPLLFGIVFSLVVMGISFVLEGGRDLNDGYLPEWEGRDHAPKSLLSVRGLLFRLNRGIIISWLLAFAVLGAAYGSIYGDMQSFLESNQLMEAMFTQSGTSIEASFTATIMMVMMGMAAILPIAIVNKLGAEESRQHFSQLFSTKVSRLQFYGWTIFLAVISGALGILAGAGGLGASALAVMSDKTTMTMSDFLQAGFNFFPVILFFTGLAGLVLGFVPSLGKLLYVYLGYSFALSYFGGILDLPDWLSMTSALNWPSQMPMKEFDATAFFVVFAVSLVLVVLGLWGYQKRDLKEGA